MDIHDSAMFNEAQGSVADVFNDEIEKLNSEIEDLKKVIETNKKNFIEMRERLIETERCTMAFKYDYVLDSCRSMMISDEELFSRAQRQASHVMADKIMTKATMERSINSWGQTQIRFTVRIPKEE